ncbi:electron transfer flavoprotein beta subunit lysine methyltransferase isoform X2 [Manduca sexta]|uniref:electron transfer flavoprotein beta subunit lysine methyltransferase isoform X2 n=1 Tax=Manduca sexta TaxID=7130 RepID=UPI00188FCAE3|nr:electron transfer flavoprotein beta subunit lysine methyltransferase isoform X2 [Manduca sexta]
MSRPSRTPSGRSTGPGDRPRQDRANYCRGDFGINILISINDVKCRFFSYRYILDNGDLIKDRKVLDVGCGCGAGSIAAIRMKAKYVLANDIDPYAIAATNINGKINEVNIETNMDNLIGTKCTEFDTILIGDMFYNEEFAGILFHWLEQLRASGKTVLIGDPGRHGLTHARRDRLQLLAKYDLPKESCDENNGFTDTTLWMLNK